MNQPQVFYRALDAVKGSWDGFGFLPLGESDFIAYVADAPSGASIQTPELIKIFWTNFARELPQASGSTFAAIELADGVNRLQNELIRKGRQDTLIYQSTLIVIRKSGNLLSYCSVGDSFFYLYRNEKLYNLAASEVWDGALVIEESNKLEERLKTGPLRMIGKGGDFVEPSSIHSIQLQDGDMLILGSDGAQDILPPDRWIPFLEKPEEERRADLERLFPAEKIKDDVTFMIITPEIPSIFDPAVEIAKLQASLERIEKEEIKLRGEIVRGMVSPGRLEKMEKEIDELAQNVSRLTGKIEDPKRARTETKTIQSTSLTAAPGSFPWIPVLVALLVGLIAGLSFFLFSRSEKDPDMSEPPSAANAAPRTQPSAAVNPPEILNPADCTYTVVRGDTLEKISKKKKIPIELLLQWNPAIKRDGTLIAGEQIQLCAEER